MNKVRISGISILTTLALFPGQIAKPQKGHVPHVSKLFFGNSFSGGKDGWVQGDALGLSVLPDGRFYLNSPWDEGFRDVGIYKDGKAVGQFRDTHGMGRAGGAAICSDNMNFVFIAMRQIYVKRGEGKAGYPQKAGESWYGVRRYSLDGEPKPFVRPGDPRYRSEYGYDGSIQFISKDAPGSAAPIYGDGAYVQGLAIVSGKLYVADYSARSVRVFDVDSFLEDKDSGFPVTKGRLPFQLAGRVNGKSLWLIERDKPYGNASVVEYSLEGKPTGRQISDLENPASIAFSPDGRLIVADDGPSETVNIYDVSRGRATIIARVGDCNWMLKGPNPGRMSTYRFNGITGAGMDASGTLFVACNEAGADLRPLRDKRIKAEPGLIGSHHTFVRTFYREYSTGKFIFSGELRSNTFVDVADMTATDIYTTQDRFAIGKDLSETGGRLSSAWKATHLNRFAYPDDPRLHITFSTPWIRRIGTHRLLFLTSMFPEGGLAIYNFDGEIAKPCAFVYFGIRRGPWPPQQASGTGPWIWTDRNGDGAFDKEEFTNSESIVVYGHVWAWQVDSRGDIWAAPENQRQGEALRVYRLKLLSFSGQGRPVYQPWSEATVYRLNADVLRRIERVHYDPSTDEMLVTGYVQEDAERVSPGCKADHDFPEGCDRDWGYLGTTMIRFEGWSKAFDRNEHPRAVARTGLPYRLPAGRAYDYPKAMDVAGNRVFVAYLASSKIVSLDAHNLHLVETVQPQPEFESSWIDLPYGIRAVQRDLYFYVFAEENLHNKNIVYKIPVS